MSTYHPHHLLKIHYNKTIRNLTLRLSKLLRTPTLCHSTGNHGDDANAGQTLPHRLHGYYSKLQCGAQPSVPTCLLPSDGPTLTKVTHRILEPWWLRLLCGSWRFTSRGWRWRMGSSKMCTTGDHKYEEPPYWKTNWLDRCKRTGSFLAKRFLSDQSNILPWEAVVCILLLELINHSSFHIQVERGKKRFLICCFSSLCPSPVVCKRKESIVGSGEQADVWGRL